MSDDLDRQRYRRDDRRMPLPGGGEGTPTILVQVYQKTTLPTTTGVFYACYPVAVAGTETEGQPGTLGADTSQTVYVLVVNKAASLGDYLIARSVGHRWVAERTLHSSGSGGVTLSPCVCTNIPTTLYFRMISPYATSGELLWQNPATLTYGPPPLALQASGHFTPDQVRFYSSQLTGSDPNGTGTPSSQPYWLDFGCFAGPYRITASMFIGPTTVIGSGSVQFTPFIRPNTCGPPMSLTQARPISSGDTFTTANIARYKPQIVTT